MNILNTPCASCKEKFDLADMEEFDGKFYCQFCYEELMDKANVDAEEER